MSTDSASEGRDASSEKSQSGLFPGIFRAALKLTEELGASPITFESDASSFDMFDGANLRPNDVVGVEAVIEGQNNGVTYELRFRLFNEAAGAAPASDVVAVFHVNAAEGDQASFTSQEYDAGTTEGRGQIAGLILLSNDSTISADFCHGTCPSEDPKVQAVLNEIVGRYGFSEADMFSEPGNEVYGFYGGYDDERLKKLADGLSGFTNHIAI